MGFYNDVILPWCVDLSCGAKELAPKRQQTVAELSGDVLEVGFGSGLNLRFMPASVTRVLAVEPSQRARKIAAKRVAKARCAVEFVGLDAQGIQLPDRSVDAALSTFTLCTIPDVAAALTEIRRVLKPGGRLFVLEHGRAPDEGVARWQDRLNGMQKKIAGGCHINRDIAALLRDAGFGDARLEQAYFEHMPRTHGYLYQGSAVRGS
jgi:ubiquinone/menaquinone biosynthesis C-methylase UbiE